MLSAVSMPLLPVRDILQNGARPAKFGHLQNMPAAGGNFGSGEPIKASRNQQ